MNRFFQHSFILFVLIIALYSCKAQKFTTHAVKKGETLTGISRQYGVDTATMLRYNTEIKQGDVLKPNTILVVPGGVKPTNTARNERPVQVKDTVLQSEEPIGFTSHRVRKRETLYGIAQRFRISENDLKKYNPELYSSPLKKGMTLKIVQYRRTKTVLTQVNEADFETYTVAPKETRWSIANKYGISVDSLLKLNPELSKASDYLSAGQKLTLPRPAGSSVENQKTQLYLSYTVPAKMNFYQLEQKFKVKSDEIVRLNPEITEKGGLIEGMVIRIPQKELDAGDINTDNYNFYEVKPKQTIFSLTRNLGVSYEDLVALNPNLSSGLKAGMVLKLPKDQEGNFEVRNSLVLDKINLIDSVDVANRPKIMFMFPFGTNALNVSDKAGVADLMVNKKTLELSMGLYSGALIALDSIADLGISVDVSTFDNEFNVDQTKAILAKENLKDFDAIIGPLDAASLKETAVRAGRQQVPLVAPIIASSELSLSNVFYSFTPKSILRKRILEYTQSQFTDQNIVIIADSANVEAKDSIVARYPKAKVVSIIEEEKNIGIKIDSLRANLSDEAENWVFVETNKFQLVASVTSILNSFQNALLDVEQPNRDRVKLKMFTTYKYRAFDNNIVSNTHLSNLRFTYPSVFRTPKGSAFSRRYEKRFGSLPDRYAVRGFDLTFDILLKLAYKKNLMEVSKFIGETQYAGNKFDYTINSTSGYLNQASYIMTIEDLRIKEVQ